MSSFCVAWTLSRWRWSVLSSCPATWLTAATRVPRAFTSGSSVSNLREDEVRPGCSAPTHGPRAAAQLPGAQGGDALPGACWENPGWHHVGSVGRVPQEQRCILGHPAMQTEEGVGGSCPPAALQPCHGLGAGWAAQPHLGHACPGACWETPGCSPIAGPDHAVGSRQCIVRCSRGQGSGVADLCCTTSRSSSFSGMVMPWSHCSFSPIQRPQASASLNIW